MKDLAIAFSARKEGNCSKLSRYCLGKLEEKGWQTELLKACDLKITQCGYCEHECFHDKKCPIEDDVPETYQKCLASDSIIFAVPTYGGHLASVYFAFLERAAGVFESFACFEEDFLKKVNFIIIGNLSAGGDMALHEALHDFADRKFWPETMLFPSREYGQSSLLGNLIERPEVKKRLDRFVEMVVKKSEKG